MSVLVFYSVKQLSFLPQSKQELSTNEVKWAKFIAWKTISLWPWVHSSIISSTYNYGVWLAFTTQSHCHPVTVIIGLRVYDYDASPSNI